MSSDEQRIAEIRARQQAATGDHQPSDGRWGPRCSPCEQPWPCRAALEAENARLRDRVAALIVALGQIRDHDAAASQGFVDEWEEAKAFRWVQDIADDALINDAALDGQRSRQPSA